MVPGSQPQPIGRLMSGKKARQATEAAAAKPRDFQVGDLAVYPAHGVGMIEAIESRVVNGEEHNFYILKVLENNMVIMIPTRNVVQVGLREVIDEAEIPKIYEVMQSKGRRFRNQYHKIRIFGRFDHRTGCSGRCIENAGHIAGKRFFKIFKRLSDQRNSLFFTDIKLAFHNGQIAIFEMR